MNRHGININFPVTGETFYIPTVEDTATVKAILEEFLDHAETDPAHAGYHNLGIRFLAWYAGQQDLGIKCDGGPAKALLRVDWFACNTVNDRPKIR